jgi:hypothetical protein
MDDPNDEIRMLLYASVTSLVLYYVSLGRTLLVKRKRIQDTIDGLMQQGDRIGF